MSTTQAKRKGAGRRILQMHAIIVTHHEVFAATLLRPWSEEYDTGDTSVTQGGDRLEAIEFRIRYFRGIEPKTKPTRPTLR
jgi:hypothetical protein